VDKKVSAPEKSGDAAAKSPADKINELYGASNVDWSAVLSEVQSSAEAVSTIAGNSSYVDKTIKGHKKNKQAVNGIFDIIYESVSDENQLTRIIEARFDFSVGTSANPVKWVIGKVLMDNKEQKWGINGLRRAYGVMIKLPADHVKRLAQLTTDNLGDNCPSGVTFNSKYINIAYDENDTTRKESGSYADNGDAMYDMTIFDTTLAHEMGHVGDKGNRYSRDSEFLGISEWKEYKSASKVVDAMMGFIDNPLPTSLDSDDVKAAKNAAKTIVKKEKTDKDKYGKIIKDEYKDSLLTKFISLFKKGGESKADKEERINKKVNLIKGSNLIKHIHRAFADRGPWMSECFSELPKYQIHQGYSGSSWWSYKNTARESVKKNSRYQWRDPGEDFAELYATYFMGDDKKKQEIESQRREWFERVVVNGGDKKKKKK
ncbi:MAG: hypothetical protein IJU23_14540, partial [Proteobacteria bacterium]|nr:hypothetical protein [Pseudomonadota bacterium]